MRSSRRVEARRGGYSPNGLTQNERSFVTRAGVAVALLIGFYVLALGIAGGLIAFIVATIAAGGFHPWVILAALASFAILRGVFFIDRREGEASGLPIDARSEPRLMELVTQVAGEMGTRPPDLVRLVPDVNAFVYEQGRFLGLVPSKRMMGIGLALLNVLKVDELKAVLAHEYGHYAAGDTRLSGIIYRARSSIGLTIQHLGGSFIRRIFQVYGVLFLRLTQKMSREQEIAADEDAVRIGGREAHASGLRSVVGASAAFDSFVEDYVTTLWLEKRYPDNMYEGFREFLADEERKLQVAAFLEKVADQEDPYDSHPSLARRLAVVAESSAGAEPDPRPARDLLVDPQASERRMSGYVANLAVPESELAPVAWSDSGEIFARRMRAHADELLQAIGPEGDDIEGDRLARVVLVLERADANKIVSRIVPLKEYDSEAVEGVVNNVIQYYVAATLVTDLIDRHGYRMNLSWTKPFELRDPQGGIVDIGGRVADALERRDLRSLLALR